MLRKRDSAPDAGDDESSGGCRWRHVGLPFFLGGLALFIAGGSARAVESPGETATRFIGQHRQLDAASNQKLDELSKQYEAAIREQYDTGSGEAAARAAGIHVKAGEVIRENSLEHIRLSNQQQKEGHDLFNQQVEQARADADGTPVRGRWASLDYIAEAVKKFIFGKQPEKPPPFPLPSGGPRLASDPKRHTDPTKAKPKALEAGVTAMPESGGGGGGDSGSSEVVVSGTENKSEITFSGRKQDQKKTLREQVLEEVRKKLGIKGPATPPPAGH